jgi:predicted dehydrogenase
MSDRFPAAQRALKAAGSESRKMRPVTVETAYTAQAAFETMMGVFEASRFLTGHRNANTIEINGSAGSIRFDLKCPNGLEVLNEGDSGYETVLVTDPDDPYSDHWWPAGHNLSWEHALVHWNHEFFSAVADGSSHQPDFEAGLGVQCIIDGVK